MNRYLSAINRMSKNLDGITDHYSCKKIYLWIDALLCRIRYGVTPNEYIGFSFYKFSWLERKTYFTARQTRKYEKLLNDPLYYATFWDKQRFNECFSSFIVRDWLYAPNATEKDIQYFIHTHESIIVKPSSLSSGHGIHVYSGESARWLIDQQCLIEERIKQHEDMAKLNESSVNSVRVYTIIDKNGKPNILSASIRVGGRGSVVDNYHSGGVGYPLDCDTGVVSSAGVDINGRRWLFHPECGGVKVIGFQVPRWKHLIDFVFKACQVIPTARFIAWDIAVLKDGFEMIEGNYDGDPGLMQAPALIGNLKK